jgi:Putative transposase DNA-binding domain
MTLRVYKYGLRDPVGNADLVSDQISKAHRYYNVLIEIERNRRAGVREVLSGHPDAAMLEARVAELKQSVEAARLSIRAQRAGEQRRAEDPLDRAAVRALRDELKQARAAAKDARRAVAQDPTVKAALGAIEERAKERVREERGRCGVYWGTYLLCEAAAEQAAKSVTDPTFRRWDGSGAVGVQLQGGAPVDAVVGSDSDTRLQIGFVPAEAYLTRSGRRNQTRTPLRLRVGSDGRDPIWAEWPMILHRPIPAGAIIKRAVVHRRRRDCRRWEWSVSITVDESGCARRPSPDGGACSINLGWCLREGGALRVGYVVGDDGHEEEILIPASVRDRFRHADAIRGVRDRNLDEMRPVLSALLAALDVPSAFAERVTTPIALWRSPGRFASLAFWWRAHRFAGDEAAYALLEAWRYRDEHLQRYEAGLRRAELHRRDVYRNAAARLASRYRTIVLDGTDLRAMQRSPAPESERTEIAPVKLQQRDAAPSELRLALASAFGPERSVEIAGEAGTPGITELHTCGSVETWDRAASGRLHTCSRCGETYDQDANACRNLLRLHRERLDAERTGETARGDKTAPAKLSRTQRFRAARARAGAEAARSKAEE